MKNLKLRVIILAIACLIFLHTKAEAQIKPTNVKFQFQKDELVITYDLPESGESTFYTVELKIVDSINHKIIIPQKAEGDIGNRVQGGANKKIEWKYANEAPNLSLKIGLTLTANVRRTGGGPLNALRSVIVPGWGDCYVYNMKGFPAWGLAIIPYGIVGYGVYNIMQGTKSYSSYHSATEQSNIDNFYNKAVSQQNAGYTYVYIGAAIWGADVLNVLIKGMINQGYKNRKKHISASLELNVVPFANTTGLGLTYKF